jgi:hypothetical protein
MPFFIARMSPSGRIVTVDVAAYETREEAESRADPRQTDESVWVVEAEHSRQAALLASRLIDDWKQANAARIIGPRQSPETR